MPTVNMLLGPSRKFSSYNSERGALSSMNLVLGTVVVERRGMEHHLVNVSPDHLSRGGLLDADAEACFDMM